MALALPRKHPQGSSLDSTLPEEMIQTKQNRRRADRAIWAGLGRDPEEGEAPTIVVEFVSSGKVNQERDYVAKRAEYREIGVREYWVIDRFRRTLTVFIFGGETDQERVIPEKQSYETPLLPGFELPLARLLTLADRWAKKKRTLNDPPCPSSRRSGSSLENDRIVVEFERHPLSSCAIWRPRSLKHRWSAWSWAASPTGRRCAMPPRS